MKMTRAGPSQKAEHVRSIEPESATLRVPPHAVVTSRGSVYAELRQRLAAGLEFVSSLGGLIAKNISHTESELSVAIAEKWLRNASQRVFSDPHRFLVELVVNGVDATIQRGGSRGQFGMGFLACLEFLGHKETNGTQIKIKSRTEIDDYELNISGALENPQLVINILNKHVSQKAQRLKYFLIKASFLGRRNPNF